MSQERTEKATPKRIEDARKKGQIARSRDLAQAAATIAAIMVLAALGGRLVRGMTDLLAADLASFGDAPLADVTAGQLSGLVLRAAGLIGLLVGPVAAAAVAAAVGMNGVQGGWIFAPTALQPNFSRLSPAKGFKRLGFSQSGADTLKTILAVSLIAYLSWQVTLEMLDDANRFPWLSPAGSAWLGWSHAETLLWRSAWGLAVIALLDYALQKYRFAKSLRMTKQEVRDEARQREGSAEVKYRVRRIQREMAQRRMMSRVPQATVVITNPTHYAVALEYRREAMAAPRVIAKGRDHLALRIREIARQHGIPIVENKPLAQTLYGTADVGETIPAPLFAAVAEVLAHLVRLKQIVI